MLTYNFLEWVKIKESVLEEGRYSQMSSDGVRPKPNDLIVFEPLDFLDKAISAAQSGKKINPTDKSLQIGLLSNVEGTVGSVQGDLGQEGENRIHPEIFAKPENFRDVTDAFETELPGTPKNIRFLLFMGLRPHPTKLQRATYAKAEQEYEVWRNELNPIKQKIDPQQLAITNWLKGPEAARSEVEKAGASFNNDWLREMSARAKSGEDVSSYFDPRELSSGRVKHIRSIGAGAIVDQLHQKGMSVPGEENGPPQKALDDFDRLFEPSQQEPMSVPAHGFEPGTRNVISTNPQQLQAIGQAREKLSPEQEKQRRMMQVLQREFPSANVDVAHHDPMIPLRKWKAHNDTRFYPYFPA